MSTSENSNGTDNLWEDGVRAFLSHKAEFKAKAAQIKVELRNYGIAAFLAHDDIAAVRKWQDEIVRALDSMELMIALLTPDFKDSEWTSQEIGYALGRGIPVIPVSFGLDPYGFISPYQAISIPTHSDGDRSMNYKSVAKNIFGSMFDAGDNKLRDLATDAFVQAVSTSPNFNTSNYLASYLPKLDNLSIKQIESLIFSYNNNSEVTFAFGFRDNLAPRLSEITGKNYVVSKEIDQEQHTTTQKIILQEPGTKPDDIPF